MLTVKYIDQTGVEQLIEATGTIWHPHVDNTGKDPKDLPPNSFLVDPAHMTIILPKEGEMELRGFGSIYVMNESGKTVGSYLMDLMNGPRPA